MAWKPSALLIDGVLENINPGKVTGWLRFVGIEDVVSVDLEGDFHRDIRGAVIRLKNEKPADSIVAAMAHMDGFSLMQKGKVGDITAGLPPYDYVEYPFIEWYSDANGRVVLEPKLGQIEVVGTPRPWETEPPVSRDEQGQRFRAWLKRLAGLGQSNAMGRWS